MEYRHVSLDNHPKNEEGVFRDLVEKWNKFGTLYIGVDFDNTLWPYETNWNYKSYEFNGHEVPDGFYKVLGLLRWCKVLGMKLCLWSLPTSLENLNWKVEWCALRGIEMDYVNESPLLKELNDEHGFKKVHFNLLLDDVAGLESAYSILYNLCEYIENQIFFKEEKDGYNVIKD